MPATDLPAAAPAAFHTELQRVAAAVRAAIAADDLPATLASDLLRDGITAYPTRPGKMLRAALAHWSCGAAGGQPATVLPLAAAIEVFHCFTLVHDDIIDEDETRRGGPATHCLLRERTRFAYPAAGAARQARHGQHQAMLAGDVQHAWANALLARATPLLPPAVVLAWLDRLNRVVAPAVLDGEALDVEFELRPPDQLPAADLERMLRRKTGALLRFAAEAGALAGRPAPRWDDPLVVALGDFAEHAGLAFQLHDDLLGLYGAPATLGKPVGSDLRQGKRTLLFCLAAERLTGADRARVRAALGDPALPAAECDAVRCLLRDCGAVAAVEAQIADGLAVAAARLALVPASPSRDLLAAWLAFLRARSY